MGDTEDAASRAPWSDTVNMEKNIDLAAELGKDSASKGSFIEDYEAMSLAADIVPCNRFNCLQDGAVVRLANTTIDIASWRCMLLAIATAGSLVKELSIHACELSPDHMTDLVTALEKVGTLDVLKLDFLKIRLSEEQEGVDVGKYFLSVLSSEKFTIKYLSLRGSLGNDFVSSDSFYTALVENVVYKASILLQTLCLTPLHRPYAGTPSQHRNIRGQPRSECLYRGLLGGFCCPVDWGIEASPEEDTAWKNVAKLVGDKNKAIKDANKTRKKKGYPDLEEITAPVERLVRS